MEILFEQFFLFEQNDSISMITNLVNLGNFFNRIQIDPISMSSNLVNLNSNQLLYVDIM